VKRTKTPISESQRSAELAGVAVELHGGALLRYLLRCRGCEQDANDLAQEVYMELLRVSEPEAIKQPQAYLYRIASHVVYRFKRRRQRESDFVTFDSETVARLEDRPQGETVEETRQTDAIRELERLMDDLPPLHRAIILMCKRDGMSYAQAAHKLGVSVHTVKKYLHRAMVHMRRTGWDTGLAREES
jgi:RNA polymerase sigma factor (sigma-70 family)